MSILARNFMTGFSTDDALGLSPASGYELALSALGACVWCLKRAHIDNSILTLASFKASQDLLMLIILLTINIQLYQPLDSATTQNDYLHTKFSSQRLVGLVMQNSSVISFLVCRGLWSLLDS